MAASKFPRQQFISGEYVESCGAVLFEMSPGHERVCLLRFKNKDHDHDEGEWLLPKGRRRESESRAAAAIRETTEETGYKCTLVPVKMPTRAPLAVVDGGELDQGYVLRKSTEPFYLTVRNVADRDGTHVKLIYWYIAALNAAATPVGAPAAAAEYETSFFSPEQALHKLTFQDDRNVLRQALKLLNLDPSMVERVNITTSVAAQPH